MHMYVFCLRMLPLQINMESIKTITVKTNNFVNCESVKLSRIQSQLTENYFKQIIGTNTELGIVSDKTIAITDTSVIIRYIIKISFCEFTF